MKTEDLVAKWEKTGLLDGVPSTNEKPSILIESQSHQPIVDKIDVFGSTGFIGSRFCNLYPNEVVRVSRDCNIPDNKEILYFISTTDNYNVFTDIHIDINTNLNKLMDVLENCKDREFTKDFTFNFISSWFVYGIDTITPIKEDHLCNPRGFYSITKKAAEDLLMSYCKTFGIKYRIFRLCNVYGIGDVKRSKKKNALQYLLEEIKANRDINLYDGGEFYRDYMYVDDVCRAIKMCIEKIPPGEIVNIGSGNLYMFKDLIEMAIKKSGSTSKAHSVEPTGLHQIVQSKNICLDITKLKSTGFKPQISIEEGIGKLL